MKNLLAKKIAVFGASALLSINLAQAQGLVQFDNFGGGVDAPITYLGAPVEDTTGRFMAGLWIAAGADQAVESLVFSGLSTPFVGIGGYFLGGSQAVAGFAPGSQVTVQVRAWDTETGATWDLAVWKGASNLLNITLGGAGAPPSLPALLTGLQGFAIVPEPSTSTFALAGLGAAAMLILRRRK